MDRGGGREGGRGRGRGKGGRKGEREGEGKGSTGVTGCSGRIRKGEKRNTR